MPRAVLPRLLLPALLACAASLSAQTPDPTPTPPPLWSGKGELSYVATSGNTDTQTLGAGAELEYRPSPWAVQFKAAFVRSEADDVENARALTASLRGSRTLTPRLEVFARGDYLKNRFAGIEDRYSGEGGAAYAIFPDPPHELKVEGGLGYTRELRTAGEDLAFPTARVGFLYEWQISRTATYAEEFSFVSNLEEGSDWRVVNTGSLTAEIVRAIAVKLSFAILYSNEPVPGFRKRDTLTSAAIVAKFP
jgi:putative salt-induced outer membrane protein